MSILDGIGRTFKSIVKSPSKLLLASAAVYLGGGAMGWWETPFESINGVWAGTDGIGATSAGAGGSVGSSALTSAMSDTSRDSSIAQSFLESAGVPRDFANSGDQVASAFSGSSGGTQPAASGQGFAGASNPWETAAQKADGGIVSLVTNKAKGFLGATGDFIKQNPVPSMVIGSSLANAGASMLQPNAVDVLREKAKIEREEADRRRAIANQNMAVGNVNLGLPRSGGMITRTRSA